MPPGRDSFRRNRVAPFCTLPFYHSPQSNPIRQSFWAVSSQVPLRSPLTYGLYEQDGAAPLITDYTFRGAGRCGAGRGGSRISCGR